MTLTIIRQNYFIFRIYYFIISITATAQLISSIYNLNIIFIKIVDYFKTRF